MALGAYSIVRFSNNMNDQRVNLGVIVWHPVDGLSSRFSPFLDRVHAVDPRVTLTPLRAQLEVIKNELEHSNGKATLEHLSTMFRDGLEVTPPCPARLQSINEAMARLYTLLVSPTDEVRRAGTQKKFESSVKKVLFEKVHDFFPDAEIRDIGERRVNGVSVDVGIRTKIHRNRVLWRALSLQSEPERTGQIIKAKATAMDIGTIKGMEEFRGDKQFVVLQTPKPQYNQGVDDSVAWLLHEANDVFLVQDIEALPNVLSESISSLG